MLFTERKGIPITPYHFPIKCVRIWSSSGPYFRTFGQKANQNNSEYGYFLRSKYNMTK